MKRNKLKKFRKENKLTQEAIAKKLNLSKSHYINIERGIYNPSYELLERFTEIFKTKNVWELFEKESSHER